MKISKLILLIVFVLFMICSINKSSYAGNGFCPYQLHWGMSSQDIKSKGFEHEKVYTQGDINIITNYTERSKLGSYVSILNMFVFYKDQLSYITSFFDTKDIPGITKQMEITFGKETINTDFNIGGKIVGKSRKWQMPESMIEIITGISDQFSMVITCDNKLHKHIK